MSVSERLQEAGSYDITLIDDTPPSILHELTGSIANNDINNYFFSHIVITGNWIQGQELNDTVILPAATYTGVVRSLTNSGRAISGASMLVWLGDEEGKGNIIESSVNPNNDPWTLEQWIDALLPASIQKGTIAGGAGTFQGGSAPFIYETPRTLIDLICSYFGVEYKITPDGKFHTDLPANLFNVHEVVVTRRESGSEPNNLQGLVTTRMGLDVDCEDYVTKVIVLGEGLGVTIATGSAIQATNFKDFFGNAVQIEKTIDLPEIYGGTENDMAAAELAATGLNTRIDLDTETYRINEHVKVGDYLWVYDPERGIVDINNPVPFRGSYIYPKEHRVYAYTWPVESGMGVYFRKTALGTEYIDLTPYVVWEEGTTSTEPIPKGFNDKSQIVKDLFPELF